MEDLDDYGAVKSIGQSDYGKKKTSISEWYFGSITRQDTESTLISTKKNSFLVRTSSYEGTRASVLSKE